MNNQDNFFIYDLNKIQVPKEKQHDFNYAKHLFEEIGNPKVIYVDFNDSTYSIIIGTLLGSTTFEFCFKSVDGVPLVYFREG